MRGFVLTIASDPVWAAVTAAEDAHGEVAEGHARREAERLFAEGDVAEAEIWDAAASILHDFHTINRRWVRPQDRAMSDRGTPTTREQAVNGEVSGGAS